MTRFGIFSLTAAALVVIESSVETVLRLDSTFSLPGLFARGLVCTLAGYAITRRKTDDLFVAPILVCGAEFISLSISDFVILLAGARGAPAPRVSFEYFVFGTMGLPAIASLVGAGVALVLARRAAPQQG